MTSCKSAQSEIIEILPKQKPKPQNYENRNQKKRLFKNAKSKKTISINTKSKR
jgi:hypothetical protein